MNTFDIFADSSANIPDELVKSHGIKIIPYTCTVNGEERMCYDNYEDFKSVAKRFYDDLRAGADIKTSLVDKQRIIDAVTPSFEQGRDAIIVTISSGISGTHFQALEAKKLLEEKFPDCKLYVCDSANASMGQGLQVLKICDLRDMGESAETCAKWVESNAYKFNSYLTVGDLKYLRKGGRISAAVAIAGTILNIKPLLKADGGTPAKLSVYAKERGRKKALQALADAYKENAEQMDSNVVSINHADCEEDALYLAELIKGYGAKEVIIEYYDLCTGTHVGPGTVAMFFYGKDRKAAAASGLKKTSLKTATQRV
ncbi:MAG: DegV family protein [Clostridia bacterium]|nr:DegV family protein [Clostridia bacterium]